MSFTCPDCGRTSYNPTDEEEGYCGSCHRYTGAVSADERLKLLKLQEKIRKRGLC